MVCAVYIIILIPTFIFWTDDNFGTPLLRVLRRRINLGHLWIKKRKRVRLFYTEDKSGASLLVSHQACIALMSYIFQCVDVSWCIVYEEAKCIIGNVGTQCYLVPIGTIEGVRPVGESSS